MNDTLLLELLKIVKKSKNLVIKSFEEKGFSNSFVDFETTCEELGKETKNLARAIDKEALNFNRDYKNENELKRAINTSFENINKELKKILKIYQKVKNLQKEDDIEAALSLLFVRKILEDYFIWCDKLENAFLGLCSESVIFKPNVKLESEIFNFIEQNTKSSECMLPFLGGMGLGFLLD